MNEVNLYLEAGSNFDVEFTIADDDGNPIDITNYTITSQIRKSFITENVINFAVSKIDAANGIAKLSLSVPQTTVMDGRYVYDAIYKNANGVVKFVKGIITAYPTTTKDDTIPVPGSTITKSYQINFVASAYSQVFQIVDHQIYPSSIVTVDYVGFTGINADETEMDNLETRASVNDGSITVYVDAVPGPVVGLYNIEYSIYTPF